MFKFYLKHCLYLKQGQKVPSSLSHFLATHSVRRLFDQLKDYKAIISTNNGTIVLTLDTCEDETFADIAESSHLSVTYKLQDKFKNAALLNFVNIFGETVIKRNGEKEQSSTFLRDTEKEVKTIYVDRMK